MKVKFLLPLVLVGCVANEPLQLTEDSECLAWVEIPRTQVECTGGRGVAPAICVEIDVMEQHCATWWSPPALAKVSNE